MHAEEGSDQDTANTVSTAGVSVFAASRPEVPLTRSLLQTYLDQRCRSLSADDLRRAARLEGDKILCFSLDALDMQQEGQCLDVCFNPFGCIGKPVDTSNAQPLELDLAKEMKYWCSTPNPHTIPSLPLTHTNR